MPLLPMDPAAQGGGLAPPPMGAPAGLMPPPAVPPAAAGAMALAPLAEQQAAQMQAMAQEAITVALQAMAGMPNPMAAAAQTEPGPMVTPGPGEMDPNVGGY